MWQKPIELTQTKVQNDHQPTFPSNPIAAASMLAETLFLASNSPPGGDGVNLMISRGVGNIDINCSPTVLFDFMLTLGFSISFSNKPSARAA